MVLGVVVCSFPLYVQTDAGTRPIQQLYSQTIMFTTFCKSRRQVCSMFMFNDIKAIKDNMISNVVPLVSSASVIS